MEFRDLKAQYAALKDQLDAAMAETAASGGYILGQTVAALEEELAEYVGKTHCVSCANGTDAMTLVLKTWGIGPGDAVFVPDFTFFATGEVVSLEGATPVLVDVEPATFNMNPDSLEQAAERIVAEGKLRPKVVIPVDLFGQPADYPRLRAIAQKYGLRILEDGAQGFGGAIEAHRSCSFGDAATTSFFPAKPLGCYGDGGAIFTDCGETAAILRSLRAHGRGTEKYDNVRIGMNSRLDTLQAAVLRVKFKAFRDYELDRINQAAARYTDRLSDFVQTPAVPEGYYSSWAQYTLCLTSNQQRESLREKLAAEGIPSMVYYPRPLHRQTAFAPLGYTDEDFPAATRLSECVLSLPIHPYITEQEVDRVCDTVQRALR